MIKYLFILVNTFSLLILGLFNGGNEVKLSHNLPGKVNAGKEYEVEFKIEKGDLNAFGRLKLELPEGFTLKSDAQPGCNFVFSEKEAVWEWDTLPASTPLVVKFAFIAFESAIGERALNAKFSYVENNEKNAVETGPISMVVEPAETILAIEIPGAGKPIEPPQTPNTPTVSNAEPPEEITVERVIKAGKTNTEYIVSVKINKGRTRGFAKYSDDAHNEVSAKAIREDGASFSIADRKINFVWANVVDKGVLEISYSLNAKAGTTLTLVGEYDYLEDNLSKKVNLKPDTLVFGTEPKTKPVQEKKPDDTATNLPKTDLKEPPANEPKAETGLQIKDGKASFQVQIGAFANTAITAGRLKQKFNINETIQSEMHAGLSKFMIGTHKEYCKARDHRETVKSVNGVKSAFVVAYNEGKRITVQEALMVINQRWCK